MKVLILSPHADDAELWAGATMWKHREWDITHVVLSSADDPVRSAEAAAVSELMETTLVQWAFRDMALPVQRQEILQRLYNRRDTKPDLVLCPSSTDRHQDHQVVHQEAFRAFKHTSILGFDVPYNEVGRTRTAFSPVSRDDMRKKVEACACYESQQDRPYMNPDAIWGLARVRGVECGAEYAEAFEVIRWIV